MEHLLLNGSALSYLDISKFTKGSYHLEFCPKSLERVEQTQQIIKGFNLKLFVSENFDYNLIFRGKSKQEACVWFNKRCGSV